MRLKGYSLVGLVLLVFGLVSCGSKKSDLVTNTNLPDSTKLEELFVWTENARLRKEPNLNAEVITEINGGEKVVLTGEESENSVKINLRGVNFEDVWVKVKTTNPRVNPQEGWIFKGMLTDNEEKAIAMNDFSIVPGERLGQIKIGNTQGQLEAIFGKEFITKGDIFFGDGESSTGFYVFKDSPFEVCCAVTEDGAPVGLILIRQPNSPWITAEGVKMGTTLDQLVKLNGKPIKFSGFGWAYGGKILSYTKGKLAGYESILEISLAEPDNLDGLDDFMGDRDCSTADKAILGKGVKVAEMILFGANPI